MEPLTKGNSGTWVYDERASWLNPQKINEKSRFKNFFSIGLIWHSQAEGIWHLYVLIMKSVSFKCPVPPRLTTWHLQTCQLNWQSQGEINKLHTMVSDLFCYPTTLTNTCPQEVFNDHYHWINEWTNQPTNQLQINHNHNGNVRDFK